jgi:GT2 family glycosyltransferase
MVENLYRAAENFSDTALFGPKIYNYDKPNEIWRAGCTSWKWSYLHSGFRIINRFCSLLGKVPLKPLDTIRGEGHSDKGQYDQIQNITFQIGCAQLIRVSAFEEVGLLDLDFSPYGSEDIDFCARLSKAGWKIKYIPNAICWHRSESNFVDNYYRNFINTRNILLLARKNLDPIYFAFLFLPDFVFFTMPLIIFEGLFFRQKDRLKGVLAGITWNLRDIKKRGFLLKNKSHPILTKT